MSDNSDDYVVNFTDHGKKRAESEARRQWNYVCEHAGCGQRFNRPCRLEAHLRSHNNERPFACPIDDCDKRFPRKDHVQRHLKNSHAEPERNFACDWEGCGKTFTSIGRLQRHKDVHDSKFYCTGYAPCNEAFRKQKTLDTHIKTAHLEAKPFPCTFVDPETNERCTQGYQSEGSLRKHVAKEHGKRVEEEHLCMICIPPGTESETFRNNVGEAVTIPKKPLSFASQEELQAHSREAHQPICPVCQLKLKDHYSLKSHFQAIHGDPAEQPQYQCPRPGCDSVFTRKSNLNVHIQSVHDKQLKFFCTADSVSNSKHADLHGWNGENACGAPFKAKSSLEQHIRTHHLGLQNRKATRKLAKSKKKPALSALSLLTGVGYDQGREVPCLVQDCEYRFYMDRDLRKHLRAEHFFTDDQAHLAIFERDAASGGQFWIGGLGEDLSMFDSTEPSVPQTPMPYFTNQPMQMSMKDGHAEANGDEFSGMFDPHLGDFEMTDPDAAALDAAMGLGDLPPAIDVHEGLQDGSMASIQDYVHNHQG